jgi:hypothetical protein
MTSLSGNRKDVVDAAAVNIVVNNTESLLRLGNNGTIGETASYN